MKTSRRASQFLRQFSGPKAGSGIVCFKFWQAVVAGGCPYQCAYCFLQTVPWYRFRPDELSGLLYTNIQEISIELDLWHRNSRPHTLIVGELQEGLAFDDDYMQLTGTPLTHLIIPSFAQQERNEVVFLTKSTEIDHALELEATDRVVFAWSVNSEKVARLWEKGPPTPKKRFEAAKKMRDGGWRVRFRLDPMIPIDGWEEQYHRTLDKIIQIEPEMVTIGALRATNAKALKRAAEMNGRDIRVFDYLTNQKDPSGFKHRIDHDKQHEMFSYVLQALSDITVTSLCKEHSSLWNTLGIKYSGCNCMPMRSSLVNKRLTSDQMTQEISSS